MPQLDSITFLIQVGGLFWYSWRLFLNLTGKHFPQFIMFSFGRKFCWVSFTSIVFAYKFSSILSVLMQFYFTYKISRAAYISLEGLNYLSRKTVFVERFIRRRLHIFAIIVLKLDFNLDKFNKKKDKYKDKFSFLVLKKNSHNFFFEKYVHFDVYYNIKKYSVIITRVLKFRFHDDESILDIPLNY